MCVYSRIPVCVVCVVCVWCVCVYLCVVCVSCTWDMCVCVLYGCACGNEHTIPPCGVNSETPTVSSRWIPRAVIGVFILARDYIFFGWDLVWSLNGLASIIISVGVGLFFAGQPPAYAFRFFFFCVCVCFLIFFFCFVILFLFIIYYFKF